MCLNFNNSQWDFSDHKHGNVYGNIHMWNRQKTGNIKVFVVTVGEIVHFFSVLQQSGIFHAYNPLSRLSMQSASSGNKCYRII